METNLKAQICYVLQDLESGATCSCAAGEYQNQNICIYQGENLTVPVLVSDCDNNPLDITGYTFEWTMLLVDGTISKVDPDIEIVDAPAGKLNIKFLPNDTADLYEGKYNHQLNATNSSSETTITMSGSVLILRNIKIPILPEGAD